VKELDFDISSWVTQYGDELYRYALARVGTRELAEDLVQETFLAAVAKIETFRGEGPPVGWLKTILKNKLLDLIKSRPFQETATDFSDFFNEWGIWKDPYSKWFEWHETPLSALEAEDFHSVLRLCLSKLPLKQRMVIGLRAFDGMCTEDICKELEISSSNEWILTYRARLGLRECLEKNWHLVT